MPSSKQALHSLFFATHAPMIDNATSSPAPIPPARAITTETNDKRERNRLLPGLPCLPASFEHCRNIRPATAKKIGRASCRVREEVAAVATSWRGAGVAEV